VVDAPSPTSTPILRKIIGASVKLYVRPEKRDDYAKQLLTEGKQVVVKGRDDSAEWFFVEAINLGEGWNRS
jgi:hypothetical protein